MSSLKQQAFFWGMTGVIVIITIAIAFYYFASQLNALYWFVLASATWLWVCWQLWKHLPLNRVETDAPLYSRLGIANQLTFLRGGLIALTAGFLLQPIPQNGLAWIPGLFYVVAAILDRIDGWVARTHRQTTQLGFQLDTVYDALGLIIAPLLAVSYGKLHWSYLLVSVAYYIFQIGIKWRQARNLPVYPILPSRLRRTFAGVQMGFVALVLLPIFSAYSTKILGVMFMLPLLIGFVVDWLVASGILVTQLNSQSSSESHQIIPDIFIRLKKFNIQIIQPLMRIILIALFLQYLNFNGETFFSSYVLCVFVIALLMVLLGILGRMGAFLILIPLVVMETNQSISILVIFCTCVSILLFGTGKFSLWQWDDDWVNRRDGELPDAQ